MVVGGCVVGGVGGGGWEVCRVSVVGGAQTQEWVNESVITGRYGSKSVGYREREIVCV